MTTSPSSQTPVHVEYRNGTYYGQLSSNYKRNGKGMLILDTSTVLFADWKDNAIQGMYIYLADGIRAYGNMTNGKLDGYNIISTTSTYSGNGQSGQYSNTNISQQSSNIRTFYGSFRNQKIYGRCLLIDNDQVILCQYSNNQVQQINRQKSLRQRQLYDLLKEIFPNHLYTLEEYLTKFIKTYVAQLEQLDEIARYQPCINAFSEAEGKFYGFQEVTKPSKKFGIMMRDNELISVGEHQNNLLQGIGRLYDKDYILDGAFRNGRVQGIGINFSRTNNKFVLEVHDGVEDRVEKGFGFPIREILEFRKEFHLRSIFFYNDIAILNLKQKYEGLIGHIFVTPKRPTLQSRQPRGDFRDSQKGRFTANSRSASKRIANSPLREKLSRYEMESDVIEDNSPMRNRPNEYRPVDRVSGYFKDDVSQQRSPYYRGEDRNKNVQAQYSQTQLRSMQNQQPLQNSRRYNQTHGSNRSQQRNDRYSQQNRSKNKFQERQTHQKQVYNQILRQNASSYHEVNPSQSRASRTYSNYNPRQQSQSVHEVQNRGRKDTRDLVKQLQSQEKGRRLALDEIYSKSNLYGRSKR